MCAARTGIRTMPSKWCPFGILQLPMIVPSPILLPLLLGFAFRGWPWPWFVCLLLSPRKKLRTQEEAASVVVDEKAAVLRIRRSSEELVLMDDFFRVGKEWLLRGLFRLERRTKVLGEQRSIINISAASTNKNTVRHQF